MDNTHSWIRFNGQSTLCKQRNVCLLAFMLPEYTKITLKFIQSNYNLSLWAFYCGWNSLRFSIRTFGQRFFVFGMPTKNYRIAIGVIDELWWSLMSYNKALSHHQPSKPVYKIVGKVEKQLWEKELQKKNSWYFFWNDGVFKWVFYNLAD